MVPEVKYKPPIEDLFANFWFNWSTLWPVVALLVGIGFGFFIIKKIRDNY